MGVERRHAKSIDRDDLADSGVESIKRNSDGTIINSQVATHTQTGITGTHTFTTTTGEAFHSSSTFSWTTAGTMTTGKVVLSRNGSAVTSSTGITTTGTISTRQTFTERGGVTWTLSATAGGGTLNITAGTISREDTRG